MFLKPGLTAVRCILFGLTSDSWTKTVTNAFHKKSQVSNSAIVTFFGDDEIGAHFKEWIGNLQLYGIQIGQLETLGERFWGKTPCTTNVWLENHHF